MKGLIIKDMLVMRKTLKTYALFLLFYLAMAVMGIFSVTFVVAFIQVIVMMLPISCFAYDEQAKWDRYAMALPLGPKTVVGARYLFTLLLVFSAAAFGMAASVFLSITQQGQLVENLATVFSSLGAGLLIADILLPLSYKLGPERARPYLYVVIFLPMIGFFAAAKLGLFDILDLSTLDRLPESALLLLFSLIPLGALLLLFVSYLVSVRIVSGKEY